MMIEEGMHRGVMTEEDNADGFLGLESKEQQIYFILVVVNKSREFRNLIFHFLGPIFYLDHCGVSFFSFIQGGIYFV